MAPTKKYAIYPSLEDRVIVISGGAQGIGASLVTHFAQQGSKVVFLDINESASTSLIDTLNKDSTIKHTPNFHKCDLTDIEGSLKPVAATIMKSHPIIHGLINNAAGAAKSQRLPTMSITPESWSSSISVNLSHQFFLTQSLLPSLLAAAEPPTSGSYTSPATSAVINMGSISWAVPSTGSAAYATCKSAVVGLTRTLAHEFGAKGVRVNSIMPGSIATEAEVRDVHTPEYKEWIMGRQALKRFLGVEDVSRMALWLVADDGEGCAGQNFVVDGGWI